MRSGSWPCRHLGSPSGTSLAWGTPCNHTRPVDRDGMRPMMRHGCTTHPTPRCYQHPSIHNSLLRTIESWMASTLASEDWKSIQMKFKIYLTLMCRIRDSGTYNSRNSSQTSLRCLDNNRKHGRPTGCLWDTISDHRPGASLGEGPAKVTCIFYHLYFLHLFLVIKK